MNREAASLDVPVYSVFRGKIGAVDQFLSKAGRLVLLQSLEDLRTKILPIRRKRPATPQNRHSGALNRIVGRLWRARSRNTRFRTAWKWPHCEVQWEK